MTHTRRPRHTRESARQRVRGHGAERKRVAAENERRRRGETWLVGWPPEVQKERFGTGREATADPLE